MDVPLENSTASSSSTDDSRYYSSYTDPPASSKLPRQMFHASHSTLRLEQGVNELYSAQSASDHSLGLALIHNNALYKPCWRRMSYIWHYHIAKFVFFQSNISISNLTAVVTLGAEAPFKGVLSAALSSASRVLVVDISNYHTIIPKNKPPFDTKLLY